MLWVLSFTVAIWISANLPMIYLLFTNIRQKNLAQFWQLWRLAPNQFLFMTLVFPFAVFATFTCVYILVTRVSIDLPTSYPLKFFFYDNWAGVALIAAMIASLVALITYSYSGFSLDKLKPEYVTRAVSIVINGSPPTSSITLPENLSLNGLSSLNDNQYVLAVSDRNTQMHLQLLNPTTQALNVLQAFLGTFVGVVAAISVGLLCHLVVFGKMGNNTYVIQCATAITWSIVFFSIFPIFFSIYRNSVYKLTNIQTSALLDILSLIAIVVLLIAIRMIFPSSRDNLVTIITNFLPVLAVGGSYLSEIKWPGIVNNIVGINSNTGTQAIFAVIFLMLAVTSSYAIWPSME